MISVIVPIYNVEKYLAECIESILQQSYNDLEIIPVDDNLADQIFEFFIDIANENENVDVLFPFLIKLALPFLDRSLRFGKEIDLLRKPCQLVIPLNGQARIIFSTTQGIHATDDRADIRDFFSEKNQKQNSEKEF